MQVALISVLERVHNIYLPSLENLSEKVRKDLYRNDGIHLTKAGLVALEDDLITGVKSVYTDIRVADYKTETQKNNDDSKGGVGRLEGGQYVSGRHGPGGYRHQERDRQPGGGHNRRHYADQPRQSNRSWQGNTNNQMYGLQNMMRDFMFFMDNGPNRFRGRGRY